MADIHDRGKQGQHRKDNRKPEQEDETKDEQESYNPGPDHQIAQADVHNLAQPSTDQGIRLAAGLLPPPVKGDEEGDEKDDNGQDEDFYEEGHLRRAGEG